MHQGFIIGIVDTELRLRRISWRGLGLVLNAIEIVLELMAQLLTIVSFVIQSLLLSPYIIF